MGRFYTITVEGVAHTAAGDLISIKAADTTCFFIHEIHITQSTEAGDSESEQIIIRLLRFTGTVTDGSGGNVVTARPLNFLDTAFAGVAREGDTTDTTGGTSVTLASRAYNVMSGWEFVFPVAPILFGPGNGTGAESIAVIHLNDTPVDSITFDIEILVEELG